MMENYFYKVSKNHYDGNILEDAHPENAFQVKYNLKLLFKI